MSGAPSAAPAAKPMTVTAPGSHPDALQDHAGILHLARLRQREEFPHPDLVTRRQQGFLPGTRAIL